MAQEDRLRTLFKGSGQYGIGYGKDRKYVTYDLNIID